MSEGKFEPSEHFIKVQGNQKYLPVAWRLVWMREEKPDWGILTEPVEINHEKQYAVFRATIMDEQGRIIATATKMENVKGFGDWLEKAETGSVGRALAYAGFGTQFAQELMEPETRPDGNPYVVDAPQESRPRQNPQVQRPAPVRAGTNEVPARPFVNPPANGQRPPTRVEQERARLAAVQAAPSPDHVPVMAGADLVGYDDMSDQSNPFAE